MAEGDTFQRFKRLKSSRACDQCRKLRTRCDEEPILSSLHFGTLDLSNNLRERKCKRCTRLNIDCTFILPIAETRDRKRERDSSPDQFRQENVSPSQSSARPQLVPRKQSSIPSPSSIVEPMELFKQFLDNAMPIAHSKDISNNNSVLLTCCIRLLVVAFSEPNNILLKGQIESSIRMYFVQKQAMTSPSMQNIQSLLLLSLMIDDPGAGNKLISAIRMAASLQWNLPISRESDKGGIVNHIWWTLVSQDIWLYLYTGVPPIINYMSFNVPKPDHPMFFSALTTISEVLRQLIRPESVADYSSYNSAFTALIAWEEKYLTDLYAVDANSAGLSAFDTNSILRILHSVILAVSCLQDPFFLEAYDQQKTQQLHLTTVPPVSNFSRGYPSPPHVMSTLSHDLNPSSRNIDVTTSYTYHYTSSFLIGTIRTHLQHAALFSRWGYLQRFSEICMIVILRVSGSSRNSMSSSNHQYEVHFGAISDEHRLLIQNWQLAVGQGKWSRVYTLACGDEVGDWKVSLDLNNEIEEDETIDNGSLEEA